MLTSWPVRQEEVARDAGATWESRPSSRGKSDSERKITREPTKHMPGSLALLTTSNTRQLF